MVTESLVVTKPMRDAGQRLLHTAQQQGIAVLGLFWAQFDENDWRLYLVIPESGSVPDTYLWLRSVLPTDEEAEASEEYALSAVDFAVVRPHDTTVKWVREWSKPRYNTADGSVADDPRLVRRVQLTPNEAYIYYLAPEK